MLVALYFPAEFCRLQFKRLYLRLKLSCLFIYRCQPFRIVPLGALNVLQKKWLLYRLLAVQAALKKFNSFYDYAEATTRRRVTLWIAILLWVPFHKFLKCQRLTPTNQFRFPRTSPSKPICIL